MRSHSLFISNEVRQCFRDAFRVANHILLHPTMVKRRIYTVSSLQYGSTLFTGIPYFGYFHKSQSRSNLYSINIIWEKKKYHLRNRYGEWCIFQRRTAATAATTTTSTSLTTIQSCALENCEFILCNNNYVLRAVATISRQHKQLSVCHLFVVVVVAAAISKTW